MTNAGYLGITPPIDTAPPSPAEEASSAALVQTLRGLGVYESEAGRAVRTTVLDDLAKIADAWCAAEWTGDGAAPRCELRTFGSFRLDVHTPDADIDVVLVAPRHCTRAAFFDTLVAALAADAAIGGGRVNPIRDASRTAASPPRARAARDSTALGTRR